VNHEQFNLNQYLTTLGFTEMAMLAASIACLIGSGLFLVACWPRAHYSQVDEESDQEGDEAGEGESGSGEGEASSGIDSDADTDAWDWGPTTA
jgi:hypothetical protein